ncbi:hypothetical protein ACC756_17100 [Rhizobium ruizarguesonis]
MRDLIDFAFRNYRITELDEALGLTDPDDDFLRETKGRDAYLCSIRATED